MFTTPASTFIDPKPVNPHIASVIAQFEPITLPEMEGVALLERVDTKFILTEQQLLNMLANISHAYRVLEIKDVRLFHYRTLYFDTADFLLYRQHHSGKRNRYKIRFRCYEDSGLSFLETKFKTTHDRTLKTRLQVPQIETQFDDAMQAFLRTHFPIDATLLTPTISNTFLRLTLASKQSQERATLDLQVGFESLGTTSHLPRLVIAEVKQPVYSRRSELMHQLEALHVRRCSFSKYCIGVALHYQAVKHNNLKPTLLQMDKLLNRVQDNLF
ncbi:MAG: polyphosphate polymerase domain-containing protein [Chloroflexota bacterium]|nr:polyphosphate polymerase domain-containing protein [Chloroflexota bacterium]